MGSLSEADPLIKAALDALQTDTDEALQKAQEVLAGARTKGDKALVGGAQRALSIIELQRGNTVTAIEAAQDSLAAFEALADSVGQAGALRALVEALLAESKPDQAMRQVATAKERFQRAKDSKAEAAAVLLEAEITSAQEGFDVAASKAAAAMDMYKKMGADRAVGYSLLKVSEFYMSLWKPTEAVQAAQEAARVFKSVGGQDGKIGGAAALCTLAMAHSAEGKPDDAITEVNEAAATFKEIGDKAAQTATLRTKINIFVAQQKGPEARAIAKEAAQAFKAANDSKGQAGALLLVAEVSVQTNQTADAVAAATDALQLYKTLGNTSGQAAALSAIATADYDNEAGQALWAAKERAALLKEGGNSYQAADALLALANLHVAWLGKKIARCSIPSADDTIAALNAAKEAHGLFAYGGYRDGMENAMRSIARALLYNNVAPEVVEAATDPEEIFQDVMSGKYADPKNALPSKPLPTNLKVEDVVPDAKQLERGKFSWNNPLSGYSYTMIWQPAKDREVTKRKPRGSYDIVALNSGGARTTAASTLVQTRSNDAAERQEPMVVYMVSTDAKESYATTMMSAIHTLGAMITAKLPRITVVQFDESYYDWTDTKARQCNIHPVMLGMLRSLRLEAPNVTIGFVGGDTPSWMADPAPMIESIFEVVESEESEVMYKKGDPFAPLLIHRPLDEPTNFVKPGKKAWIGRQ